MNDSCASAGAAATGLKARNAKARGEAPGSSANSLASAVSASPASRRQSNNSPAYILLPAPAFPRWQQNEGRRMEEALQVPQEIGMAPVRKGYRLSALRPIATDY